LEYRFISGKVHIFLDPGEIRFPVLDTNFTGHGEAPRYGISASLQQALRGFCWCCPDPGKKMQDLDRTKPCRPIVNPMWFIMGPYDA